MPRSSAFSVPTASASMATSWVAAKMLCTMISVVSNLMSAPRPTICSTNSDATIASCMAMIQVRRRPKRSDENTSTMGPTAHLNAQGR